MGAYDIHVGGKFKRSAGHKPGSEPEFAIGCSLGILNLHEVTEDKTEPLLPRVDQNTMLDHFSRWLCGRLPQDVMERTQGEISLPTCVLDLRGVNGATLAAIDSSMDSTRLLEAKGLKGHYTTLSYCWGPSRPFVTERNTFAERCSRIAISELLKTFRQAIVVTLELGVRYL